ncbi:MAG: carbohydrate kinase family protein [Candidatus Methanomethyliaceae archaeon]|nr:carbohydrate kinase family protein [Candidatus Methanomethyliaceae archaeon]
MLDVLSAGNINIDLSFLINKLPDLDGEETADLEIFHGGSAANFAVGVSRLGLKAGILGCVGDDEFGREAICELKKAGVVTDFVRVSKGKRTGTVCVLVDKSGGRRMLAYRGANVELESLVEDLPEAKFIQLCNVSRNVLMKIKKSRGRARISLDPGGSVVELTPEDLDGVDLLLLNELECRLLTRSEYREGTRKLSEYVRQVVVKLGERGAYAFDGREEKIQRALRVKVVDTTGAGDAFDAGFITAFIKGMGIEECLRWGIATASLKIQRRGAREGLPTLVELEEFLSCDPWITNI